MLDPRKVWRIGVRGVAGVAKEAGEALGDTEQQLLTNESGSISLL